MHPVAGAQNANHCAVVASAARTTIHCVILSVIVVVVAVLDACGGLLCDYGAFVSCWPLRVARKGGGGLLRSVTTAASIMYYYVRYFFLVSLFTGL